MNANPDYIDSSTLPSYCPIPHVNASLFKWNDGVGTANASGVFLNPNKVPPSFNMISPKTGNTKTFNYAMKKLFNMIPGMENSQNSIQTADLQQLSGTINMKSSTVTIYKLHWNADYIKDRENWYRTRESGLTYLSNTKGEAAAEEAFHLTNAPDELLKEDQKRLLKKLEFKGPSLSVGDIVRVDAYPKQHSTPADYFLCKSFGWEKYDGNIIELVKYLSW